MVMMSSLQVGFYCIFFFQFLANTDRQSRHNSSKYMWGSPSLKHISYN